MNGLEGQTGKMVAWFTACLLLGVVAAWARSTIVVAQVHQLPWCAGYPVFTVSGRLNLGTCNAMCNAMMHDVGARTVGNGSVQWPYPPMVWSLDGNGSGVALHQGVSHQEPHLRCDARGAHCVLECECCRCLVLAF